MYADFWRLSEQVRELEDAGVDLLAKGLVHVGSPMTRHFHLTEINAAFDAMEARLGMKVISHHD